MRQLATEGALLSLLGGGMGLLLARILTPALASMISMEYFTVVLEPGASMRVAAVVAGAVMLATLVTGLLPALRLSRVDLQPAIAGTGRATAGSTRRLARSLVIAQMALSLLLVFAAGLLLRTMTELKSVDPGFQSHQVVTIEVTHEDRGRAPGTRVDPDAQAAQFRVLDDALNRIPGVRSAALSWLELFGGSDLWLTMHPAARPDDRHDTRVDYVTPRYFETVGMQMIAGRDFTPADRRGAPPVVVVNETLARRRLGGMDAIGQSIVLEYPRDQQPPFTVIGIVRDSKYNGLREDKVEPMAWAPLEQWPQRVRAISLRTGARCWRATSSGTLAQPSPRSDPDLMVRKITTLEDQVDETVGREIMLLQLASSFSAVALLLAAVGLYGTLAYAVARRTREFGIRMALGAEGGRLVGMMLREALAAVALGAVIGVPLAMLAGYACRRFLYGVGPADVTTLAVACTVLAAVAVVAAYGPARRASAVEPASALRCE